MKYNRKITQQNETAMCFFRTSVKEPHRKALIQITESCNLRCKHCFVAAEKKGIKIELEDFKLKVIPTLKRLNVVKVTLTGGEPFAHNDIFEIIELLMKNDIQVGICSNGTMINDTVIRKLNKYGNIHVNVSLDSFSEKSYGDFRGDPKYFNIVITTLEKLAKNKLLQGILVTPNRYSSVGEYKELCLFAKHIGAKYVLMNPLSDFGRGSSSKGELALRQGAMKEIKSITKNLIDSNFEINYIRFPNEGLPFGRCEAGNIFYIFANGDLTNCPYVVFAAKNSKSKYDFRKFISGNVLNDEITGNILDQTNFKNTCETSKTGCIASIVGSGQDINKGIDTDLLEVPQNTK